jgi:hypothetical protein
MFGIIQEKGTSYCIGVKVDAAEQEVTYHGYLPRK